MTSSSLPAIPEADQVRALNKAVKALQHEQRTKRKLSKYRRRVTTTEHTLADLQAIERRDPRTTARPGSLPMERIKVAEKAFQHRLPGEDPLVSEEHIKRLLSDINGYAKGHPGKMSPLMVTAVGSEFYLVDGHHRLEAYRRSKWRKNIPVMHFTKTVAEAREQSLRSNRTGKLALSVASRSEAAWLLVKEGEKSKAEIAELTGRGTSMVGLMRARLRSNPDLRDGTWADALYGAKQGAAFGDAGSRDAKQIEKAAKQLATVLGRKVLYNPRVLSGALKRFEGVQVSMIREWRNDIPRILQGIDHENEVTASDVNALGI